MSAHSCSFLQCCVFDGESSVQREIDKHNKKGITIKKQKLALKQYGPSRSKKEEKQHVRGENRRTGEQNKKCHTSQLHDHARRRWKERTEKKTTNPITCQNCHPRGKALVHFHLSSVDPSIPQVGDSSEAYSSRHAGRLHPSGHLCRSGSAVPSSSR